MLNGDRRESRKVKMMAQRVFFFLHVWEAICHANANHEKKPLIFLYSAPASFQSSSSRVLLHNTLLHAAFSFTKEPFERSVKTLLQASVATRTRVFPLSLLSASLFFLSFKKDS